MKIVALLWTTDNKVIVLLRSNLSQDDQGDISFGSFNLYNLQLAGKRWRKKTYTSQEYEEKICWSADKLMAMDADVIAFQELWSPKCLRDIFQQVQGSYKLAFIRNKGWYDMAVAAAVRDPWKIHKKKLHKGFPRGFRLIKRGVDHQQTCEDEDDDIEVGITQFSRAILQMTLVHKDAPKLPAIEFFATHLKSKLPTDLDKKEQKAATISPHSKALGMALSTIRRTAESAALRIILNKVMKNTDTPVVVVGDFNDSPNSNTVAIITEQPNSASTLTVVSDGPAIRDSTPPTRSNNYVRSATSTTRISSKANTIASIMSLCLNSSTIIHKVAFGRSVKCGYGTIICWNMVARVPQTMVSSAPVSITIPAILCEYCGSPFTANSREQPICATS